MNRILGQIFFSLVTGYDRYSQINLLSFLLLQLALFLHTTATYVMVGFNRNDFLQSVCLKDLCELIYQFHAYSSEEYYGKKYQVFQVFIKLILGLILWNYNRVFRTSEYLKKQND